MSSDKVGRQHIPQIPLRGERGIWEVTLLDHLAELDYNKDKPRTIWCHGNPFGVVRRLVRGHAQRLLQSCFLCAVHVYHRREERGA